MKRISRWFWSPTRDSENWAQTLVRVVGNIMRSAFTVLLLGGLVVAIWAYFQSVEDDETRRQVNRINITISTDQTNEYNTCPTGYPLWTTVENKSDKTLMSMEFEISARKRGTSTDVMSSRYSRFKWDKILPPWHLKVACYGLGNVEPDPDWVIVATPIQYTTVLRETEPWMLSETKSWLIIPPCENGSKLCKPWERNWDGQAPPKGVVISQDGTMTAVRN